MLQPFMKQKSRSTGELEDEDDNDSIGEVSDSEQSEDGHDMEERSGATQDDDTSDDDGSDDGEVDLDREAHDEQEMEEIAAVVEKELDVNLNAFCDGALAVRKIIRLAKKIHYLALLRTALLQTYAQKKCPALLLPRHVATRWSSLTCTLLVVISIKPASIILTTPASMACRPGLLLKTSGFSWTSLLLF